MTQYSQLHFLYRSPQCAFHTTLSGLVQLLDDFNLLNSVYVNQTMNKLDMRAIHERVNNKCRLLCTGDRIICKDLCPRARLVVAVGLVVGGAGSRGW